MRLALACLLCLALAARAEPVAVASVPALPDGTRDRPAGAMPSEGALPLRERLDREAIRAAIAGLPRQAQPGPRRQGDALDAAIGATADTTLGALPYQAFSQDFARARLPNCLQSEGLRNQPTFFLGGVLALPFIAVAKVRGVCR